MCIHHVAHSHVARPADRHVHSIHAVESHEQYPAVEVVSYQPLSEEAEEQDRSLNLYVPPSHVVLGLCTLYTYLFGFHKMGKY